jgi:DNA-binding GntR family transcriptional regulator
VKEGRSVRASSAARASAAPSETKATGTRDAVLWLQDRIRRGLLTPGQRLVEADISRQTGAARSHVREALRKLEAEGIVVIEEFRGASVKRYTREDIRELYEVRVALEGIAAANFAAADLPDAKARLAKLQRDMNKHERDVNHDLFARTNDAWHSLIIESAGNAYLKQFLERLRVPIYRLLHRSFYNVARLDASNAGHKKITAAILAGKPKDAERLMRAHVADGMKVIATIDVDLFG